MNKNREVFSGYNQELKKDFIKSRKKSDEALARDGAGIIFNGEQIILNPTAQQQEKIKTEHTQRSELIDEKIKNNREETMSRYSNRNNLLVFDENDTDENKGRLLEVRLLQYFKKKGVIIEMDGVDVYDMDIFKNNYRLWQNLVAVKYIQRTKNKDRKVSFSRERAIKLLGDKKIISVKDYKKQAMDGIATEKMQKKALFNIPHSVADVVNVKLIKNKEYYLNYWDAFRGQRISQQEEFLLENGDKINLIELYMAVKIFRDLNGYRDKSGRLMIFNNKVQKFIPIGIDVLTKLKVFKTVALGMHQTLTRYCPHLLESGLLKLSDFQKIRKGEENSKNILRTEKIPISPRKFQVGFDGVVYYLGGKYFDFGNEKIPIKNIKAVDLDANYIGIVRVADGREELVYKILKVKNNEKRNLLERGAYKIRTGSVIDLKSTLTKERIEKYQIADIIPRGISESAEEYAGRLKKLPDYKEINTVTNELSVKTGVGIHNLPWREQIQIAQMSFESSFDENKKKRFIDFVKNYGLTGLRAFLSLEQGGLEMGEKILLIGERFREENKEIADGIFAKYAELVDTVYEIENYLKEQFEKEDPQLAQKVQEELLLTGKAVLKMFADKKMTAETARQRLEEINIQTNRFAVTIQNLSREDIASLNLTRAKDSTLDIISNPAELLEDKNKKILNQILELVVDKFPGENEKSAFLADLQNDNTESVVISRLEKEVLSFFMKKKTTKGLYEIDWVTANSNSSAKGLGEATLVSGFKETYQGGEEYRAVAKPFVKTFRIFIEKLGFVAHQGITADGEYAHHYAKMRRLQTDQDYSSKNFSPEQNRRFIKVLKQKTSTPNKVEKMEFVNKQYQVAKIIFENTDYHKDVTKNDSDGFIYREIEKQNKQGKVLTRFIPDSYAKDNRVFYAVFE